MSKPKDYPDAQWHVDAIADTGEGYTVQKGWHLSCLWCEWTVTAPTKRAAIAAYRVHEQERMTAFTLESATNNAAAAVLDALLASKLLATDGGDRG